MYMMSNVIYSFKLTLFYIRHINNHFEQRETKSNQPKIYVINLSVTLSIIVYNMEDKNKELPIIIII